MALRNFHYDDLSLRVEAVDTAHLDWLHEFFAPHFGSNEQLGRVACTLELIELPARFAALDALAPSGVSVDCFGLDTEMLRLPVREGASGERVAYDEYFATFYVAHPLCSGEPPHFEIVTQPGNESIRTPLMRVVREFAMNHALSRRELFLHASAVAMGDAGVLMTGAKKAGKTSLMTALLASGEVDFVSNDRVAARADEAEVRLRGMPSIVMVRPDMLSRFPDLTERFMGGGYNHRRSLQELAAAPELATRQWADGRFGLTPAQLCDLMAVRQSSHVRAHAILFPRITGEDGGIQLRSISEREAAQRLPRVLLGASHTQRTSKFFTLPGDKAPTQKALSQRCAAIASRVTCYDCDVGQQAYVDPSKLVEQLRQAIS